MLNKQSDTADSGFPFSLVGFILLNCGSNFTVLGNTNLEFFTQV